MVTRAQPGIPVRLLVLCLTISAAPLGNMVHAARPGATKSTPRGIAIRGVARPKAAISAAKRADGIPHRYLRVLALKAPDADLSASTAELTARIKASLVEAVEILGS
jgi:hypothetical protein